MKIGEKYIGNEDIMLMEMSTCVPGMLPNGRWTGFAGTLAPQMH